MNGDYLSLGILVMTDNFTVSKIPKKKKKEKKRPFNMAKYFPLVEALADFAN